MGYHSVEGNIWVAFGLELLYGLSVKYIFSHWNDEGNMVSAIKWIVISKSTYLMFKDMIRI